MSCLGVSLLFQKLPSLYIKKHHSSISQFDVSLLLRSLPKTSIPKSHLLVLNSHDALQVIFRFLDLDVMQVLASAHDSRPRLGGCNLWLRRHIDFGNLHLDAPGLPALDLPTLASLAHPLAGSIGVVRVLRVQLVLTVIVVTWFVEVILVDHACRRRQWGFGLTMDLVQRLLYLIFCWIFENKCFVYGHFVTVALI